MILEDLLVLEELFCGLITTEYFNLKHLKGKNGLFQIFNFYLQRNFKITAKLKQYDRASFRKNRRK